MEVKMQYRPITGDDAPFLTKIFSVPEYDLYFLEDILILNPQIRTITLDVQKRNAPAVNFYKHLGFKIISEEYQTVNEMPIPYYNLQFNR
ncbi:MAG: GNAT family N-acetyltransferase [Clostridia bacterium]|nr:GNAT family N-acetyltransferase [Clostridia bacterium]